MNEAVVAGGIAVLALLFLFSLCASALALVAYILRGIGLLKICDRLGLDCGWMGFLPIFEDYQLGAIAEKEKPSSGTKWSIILLVLAIVAWISSFAGGITISLSGLFPFFSYNGGELTLQEIFGAIFNPALLGLWSITSLIPLAYKVLRYVCIGKMYRMYLPGKVAGMMVLTILLPISYPFIVFAIRKKQPIDPSTGRLVGYIQ